MFNRLSQPNASLVMTAYRREDLPDSYHIKNHRRTAPIVVVPNPGYRIHVVSEMKTSQNFNLYFYKLVGKTAM